MKSPTSVRFSGLLLFMTAAIFLVAQTSNAQHMETSCHQFVQAFYDWYAPVAERASTPGPASGPGFPLALKAKPHAFSPKLLQWLWEDHKAQANADEIVGLDFDPLLNSQDPCQRYVAEKVTVKADRYFVEVHSVCDGRRSDKPDVIAELVHTNGRWVFVNFHYGTSDSGGLLSILKNLRELRQGDRNEPKPKPIPGKGR